MPALTEVPLIRQKWIDALSFKFQLLTLHETLLEQLSILNVQCVQPKFHYLLILRTKRFLKTDLKSLSLVIYIGLNVEAATATEQAV